MTRQPASSMEKYKVTGVDGRTGAVVGIEVDAPSPIEARVEAIKRGLRHIAILHQPLLPEPAAPKAGKKNPRKAPKRLQP